MIKANSSKTNERILESEIETHLRKTVEKFGGLAKKFVSPGWRGAPDRVILMPEGRMVFVELKAPGRAPRKLQVKRLEALRNLGFEACVVDSKVGAEQLVASLIRKRVNPNDF